jgi:hypothetical protein
MPTTPSVYTMANTSSATASVQTITSGTTGVVLGSHELEIIAVAVGSSVGTANIAITDPPSGYTSLLVSNNTASDIGAEQAYQINTSSGTQSATWSWTDNSTSFVASSITIFFGSGETIANTPPGGGTFVIP